MTVAIPEPARPAEITPNDTDSWTAVMSDLIKLVEYLGDGAQEFFPKGIDTPAKALASMLYGRELGLPPMTASGSIYVVHGKASMSAEVQRALILRDGHEYEVIESTSSICKMRGRRKGSKVWQEFQFTIAEAQQAGFTNKNSNYKSQPAEMLLARCSTRMARAMFPDVIHGMRGAEELADLGDESLDTVTGELTVGVSQAEGTSVQRATRATRATRKAPEPQPEQEPAGELPARKPPTSHRKATEPQPEPAEDPQPEQEGAPQPGVPAEQAVMATRSQVAAMVMHMERLGMHDRDARINLTGKLTGRRIESTKELTRDEASTVLDKLGAMPTEADEDDNTNGENQ